MAEEQAAAQDRYDRTLARADMEIDRLVGILRARAAETGELRAMADIGALASGMPPAELAGLLAAALRRLATGRD